MKQKPEKKTTPKKTAVKKTAAKKTTTKKVATTRKVSTVKKSLKTSIVAYVDVGFGNTLYIRGEGAGLLWETGLPLKNVSASEWIFDTNKATGLLTFKFLINDQIWAEGDNIVAEAGSKSVSSPRFNG